MQRPIITQVVNMIQLQFGNISIGTMSFEIDQTISCCNGQKTIWSLQNIFIIGSITFPFRFIGFCLFSCSRFFKNFQFRLTPIMQMVNEKTNSNDTNQPLKGFLSTNDFSTQIQNLSSLIAKRRENCILIKKIQMVLSNWFFIIFEILNLIHDVLS